jgi:hypothetical protein
MRCSKVYNTNFHIGTSLEYFNFSEIFPLPRPEGSIFQWCSCLCISCLN